jgi:hypothetical protein
MLLASVLGGLSVSLAWAAGSTPSVRPLAGLVLIAIGLTCIGVNAAMSALGVPLGDDRSPLLHRTLVLVGTVTIGTAVGLLVAPWLNFPASSDPNSATAWVADAWPSWRGPVAGITFAAVLAITGLLVDRTTVFANLRDTRAREIPALLALTGALFTWLVAATTDASSGRYMLSTQTWVNLVDTIQRGVGAAIMVTGVAFIALVIARRLPLWTVWLGASALVVAALLMLEPADLTDEITPEIYSLSLFVPTAVAGLVWWWRCRPKWPSSWITMAPAATLALLPPILSLLDDATSRWWQSTDPSTEYQIRLAAVLGVGVLLSIFGARWRLAGLLFPGLLAVLAVTSIQLIELGRFLPQWVSFAVAGILLLAAGARWESVRRLSGHGSAWVRELR